MGRMNTPENIRIAALKTKRRNINLMEAGRGTPWEDRGNLGVVKAFYQTCVASLKRPAELFSLIRRPETAGDARWFAVGCGAVWAVSCLMHALIRCLWLLHYYAGQKVIFEAKHQPYDQLNWQAYIVICALAAFFLPVVVMLLTQLAARLFYATASGEEIRGRVQPALIVNLVAYCLGPSLLALVPVVGPAVALVWIAVIMIVAARQRLHMNRTGAIICSLIAFFAVLAVIIVGMLAVRWILGALAIEKVVPQRLRQFR